MTDVVNLLNAADTLLLQRGWRQGCADESERRLTLREALFLAVSDGEWRRLTSAESALYRYAAWFLVGEMPLVGPRMLSTWNDYPGRTFAEVRSLIAAAVDAAARRSWRQRVAAVPGDEMPS